MLTGDLLRARRRGETIRPLYVDAKSPEILALATRLCALFTAHVGRRRGELEGALSALIGEQTDFLLHRGLAKLLLDRSTFEIDAPCDPVALRRRVFEHAGRSHPIARAPGNPLHPVSRAEVLAAAAAELALTPPEIERALYADLQAEQLLRTLEPVKPEALLERYNLALAQAVLLRASSLTLKVEAGDPKRTRQLFRFIKFYGLMHTVRGERKRGYEITLDGPMSLFQLSSKYGLKLAEFLPALVRCEGWSMRAEVLWGKERRPAILELDARSGLRSHYPDKGVYVTEEERHFARRFKALESAWRLERTPKIIDLGGEGVLIPDFVLRHRDDGREALLEIVGFWRRGYLERRIALLQAHAPPNLILAVSRRLRSSAEELAQIPGEVVMFKDVIPSKEILARAERVAR